VPLALRVPDAVGRVAFAEAALDAQARPDGTHERRRDGRGGARGGASRSLYRPLCVFVRPRFAAKLLEPDDRDVRAQPAPEMRASLPPAFFGRRREPRLARIRRGSA
jgi:hypothetical protein